MVAQPKARADAAAIKKYAEAPSCPTAGLRSVTDKSTTMRRVLLNFGLRHARQLTRQTRRPPVPGRTLAAFAQYSRLASACDGMNGAATRDSPAAGVAAAVPGLPRDPAADVARLISCADDENARAAQKLVS